MVFCYFKQLNFINFIDIISMIDKFEGRYVFLSNFYPCKIEHKGITYPSVEHYYVAMKVTEMQLIDGKYYTAADFREMLPKIKEPGDVKKLGQRIKVRKDWDDKKLEFMNWAVRQKFKEETLSEMLLSTGEQELIEGNWWRDFYWGVCNGKGENHLGKILMQVREELKLSNQKPSIEDIIKDKNKLN
jgi:N-glycosidase YbiA